MRSYGQYCPVARTAELFAERWTPIIVRNLLTGAATFGDVRDGAPGIPKALLADRLKTLIRAGVVVRHVDATHKVTYHLTPAGRELKAVCDAMGRWGMRWLEVEPDHLNPTYILWATARLVDTARLPEHQVTVRVELSDAAPRMYWILLHRPQVEVCTRYPGTPEDLVVHTNCAALAHLHLRQASFSELVRQDQMSIDGPTDLARALPTWLRPSPYAEHSGNSAAATHGETESRHARGAPSLSGSHAEQSRDGR